MPIQFKLQPAGGRTDDLQGTILAEDLQIKTKQLKIEASYANGAWSGTIFDEQGNAMPGASISVAETTKGTVSNREGTFSVKADGTQELHVSFVGYETVRLVKSND